MGGRGSNFKRQDNDNDYISRTTPISVDVPVNGATVKSYGEGNRYDEHGRYHVYLTDSVGGLYVDAGRVEGHRIGETVQDLEYEGFVRNDGKIITAHIYPNGDVDYMVEFPENRYSRRGRKSFSKQTLDR